MVVYNVELGSGILPLAICLFIEYPHLFGLLYVIAGILTTSELRT
jgi:hypothetical protein